MSFRISPVAVGAGLSAIFSSLLFLSCGDAEITLADPPTRIATSVSVFPLALNFGALGRTSQFTATVRDQAGTIIDPANISWATSSPSVITVSPTGFITAVGVGESTITATSGSVTGRAMVTVMQVPASLELSDTILRFSELGDTTHLNATVKDANGSIIMNPIVRWVTSDTVVASISAEGLVTAITEGTSTTIVSSGLVADTATLVVHPRVLIAFIADQGWEEAPGSLAGPRAVLQMIKNEGADLVVHQGDFDYLDNPVAWMAQINQSLGPNYPYLASPGNHDTLRWNGSTGYRALLESRATRLNNAWTGIYGEMSSILFKGVRILMGAPGYFGRSNETYAEYFREQLAVSEERWRFCGWHANQTLMQTGGKDDEVGWGVYEACREGGAIIGTGHDHVYSRTYLLSNMSNPTITSTADTMTVAPGETFVFVSGLGGLDIREQIRYDPWWASVYNTDTDQDATYGALFGDFDMATKSPGLTHFYFKNIRGEVIDEFWIASGNTGTD